VTARILAPPRARQAADAGSSVSGGGFRDRLITSIAVIVRPWISGIRLPTMITETTKAATASALEGGIDETRTAIAAATNTAAERNVSAHTCCSPRRDT
jgi:hypothetical protein